MTPMPALWDLESLMRRDQAGAPAEHAAGAGKPASNWAQLAHNLDVQQMSDMLDAQFRLREAAQAGRMQAIRALTAAAEVLCASQWDGEKRAGSEPDNWPPEQIGAFIVRHTRADLQRAALAARPDLAVEHDQLVDSLADARAEVERLHALVQSMQAETRRRPEAAADMARHGQDDERGDGEPGAQGALAPADLKQIMSVPAERIDAVLSLMASTGLARTDEVRERLAAQWGVERGSSRVGQAVRAVLHHGLLQARPCIVEWPGEKTRQFLTFTPDGLARVSALGLTPAPSEFDVGMKHHKTPDHLYLVLRAADILRAEGYTQVNFAPDCLTAADGDYCPDIAALENGRPVYVECERSRSKLREAKWDRAAQVSGGIIRLVTPNRKIMDAITSEIKATTGSRYKIWAFNISEYQAGARGANNTIWLHQR